MKCYAIMLAKANPHRRRRLAFVCLACGVICAFYAMGAIAEMGLNLMGFDHLNAVSGIGAP